MAALAVKYRPSTLDEVVGQEETVSVIRGFLTTLDNRPILLCGVTGGGKTTIARLIAHARSGCTNLKGGVPCMECNLCKSTLAMKNPNIVEIDSASNRGINEIKALQSSARLKPMGPKFKTLILDECHQLTKPAWNASLKIFEDPPKHTQFVLCTTELHSVPHTIQNRCLIVHIGTLREEQISALLRRVAEAEQIPVSDDQVSRLAQASRGHPRDALALLERVQSALRGGGEANVSNPEQTDTFIERLIGKTPESMARYYVKFLLGADPQKPQSAERALQIARTQAAGSGFVTFLQMVCETLRSFTWFSVAPNMANPSLRPIQKELSSSPMLPLRIGILTQLHELHMVALGRAKEYVIPPDALAEGVIIQSLNWIYTNAPRRSP